MYIFTATVKDNLCDTFSLNEILTSEILRFQAVFASIMERYHFLWIGFNSKFQDDPHFECPWVKSRESSSLQSQAWPGHVSAWMGHASFPSMSSQCFEF